MRAELVEISIITKNLITDNYGNIYYNDLDLKNKIIIFYIKHSNSQECKETTRQINEGLANNSLDDSFHILVIEPKNQGDLIPLINLFDVNSTIDSITVPHIAIFINNRLVHILNSTTLNRYNIGLLQLFESFKPKDITYTIKKPIVDKYKHTNEENFFPFDQPWKITNIDI